MKTPKNLFIKQLLARQACGQALVIVLAFVMLMTVMILVFFSSVSTERASSKAAASGNSARQLAQSAVQIVEGTITQATVPSATDGTATAIAWASQPGMIRTYGGGTVGSPGSYSASSAPLAYYKLYSSLNPLIVTASTNPSIGNYKVDSDIIGNWDQYPALYNDLNAPGTASDGSTVYPIVDPRAKSAATGVDGFDYATTTAISGVPVDGVVGTGAAGSLLPMPVAWIYVLKDGTLTVPASGNATSATFATTGTTAPSAANPIVGRIAYWTDDDCSKVNLNTASEGTYWDAPIANSGSPAAFTNTTTVPQAPVGDLQFAAMQPAQNEYQRYPGHPATTCLSEVFGNAINATSRQGLVETIDGVTPRYNDSSSNTSSTPYTSSLGGTQNSSATVQPNYNRLYATVDDFNFSSANGTPRIQQNLGTAATTQQIIEQSRFFLTTSSKGSDLNLFGLPRVTIWPVWDTTGAGGGTYPNANNGAKRSITDNEMIHCSTVNNTPSALSGSVDSGAGSEHLMEFTRDTALSPTIDYNLSRNQQLISYLHTLMKTGVPGFGGNFATKYSADSDQILTEIFDYIRCTNLADQSRASSFSSGTGNAVCTSSYTPSSILAGSPASAVTSVVPVGEVVPTQGAGTTRGFGRFPTISELLLVATKIDDRNSSAASEGTSSEVQSMNVTNGGLITTVLPASQTLIEWALIPQFFSPMAGFTGMGNNVRVQFIINGLSFGAGANPSTISANPTSSSTYSYPITSPGTSSASPTLTTTPYTPDLFDGAYPYPTGNVTYPLGGLLTAGRIGNGRDSVIGGVIGPLEMLTAYGSFYPNGLVRVPATNAKCGSAGGGTMTISATSITVNIYSPAGTGATGSGVNLVQSLNFTLPPTTVPIPLLDTSDKYFRSGCSGVPPTIPPPPAPQTLPTTSTFVYGTDVSARGPRIVATTFPWSTVDTIRTLVPNLQTAASGQTSATLNGAIIDGDMRLIAMSASVPKTAFMPSLKVNGALPNTTTDYDVNGTRASSGSGLQPDSGFAQGTVFNIGIPPYASNPYGNTPPAVPAGITQVTMTGDGAGTTPGDWDNGPALMCDGPYLNKADEGETASPGAGLPYLGNYQTAQSASVASSIYFSPSRQISSPVMFGSLLVGPDHPWRTLLFRPADLPGYQVPAGYTHPGNSAPNTTVPDHLLLDLFRMPVVEPYAISEPLATSGQVNLNTQIAPFTYITRTTGLRAVLKSVMVTALPSTPASFIGGNAYKYAYPQRSPGQATRYPIDLNGTLAMLNPGTSDANSSGQTAFPEFTRLSHSAAAPNFFVSPSQICDLPLIPLLTSTTTPTGPISTISGGSVSLTGLASFWTTHQPTGDNSLERPYSLIYSRVTTRSNTFTIHVRAQSLQKISNSPQTIWTEGADQITSDTVARSQSKNTLIPQLRRSPIALELSRTMPQTPPSPPVQQFAAPCGAHFTTRGLANKLGPSGDSILSQLSRSLQYS